MAQARSSRPRERIARAALLLASAILGSLPVAALASVPYDAILEWNGPYFHVKNAPTVDQLVDTPSHDIPFLSPFAVAARPHGSRNVVYVLDTGHNRVQFFEANARFVHADQTAFTWRQSGAIAASQWNSVRINLAEWAASANHWVIPFSETLIVNGVAWRRVADLGNFTAADHVYTIDYSAPANAPSLIFPVGSLVQTDVFSLEYAISDNETGAPSAFGIGDVDYGIGAGSAPILGKIDQSSGGPASWQQVRAIALIPDEADSTADDIFLVDAADNSTARNEKLFEYRVTNAGSVAYVGSYDDSLRAPASAVAARSGASDPATAGLAGGPGPFSSAVVSDPAEVTGHTYDVSVAGSAVSITDRTTGRVLISSAAFSDLADPFLAVPGLSLSKAGSAGADMAITTVRAVCNRYLLVTDTGDNRIKVISAGGGAPGEWPGNWLAGRSHTGRPQPSGADQVGATADIDYDNVTPSPVPEDYGVYTSAYPIKEGTLLSITFDPDGTPSVWTQVPGMDAAGPTDRVYELDWPSGRITFGDGVHGRIPPAGTAFRFDCVTSPDVLRYGSSGASAGRFAAPTGIAARWNETTGAFDVYVADSGNNRIQKLAFHPDRPDLRLPARVDFLCQWNTGASDADTLVDPVDLDVALDRQRSGTGQTCYLAVADQGNHRLLVYRDAAATTGGGTAVPAFDFVTGAAGDTLGSFSGISGIRFVPDGDALDLFTADTSRGEITKFQESPAPSLTLLFAGPSALPRSFPTSSSYPFSFIPRNPPAGGWIDFYYDTSSTFNISTSRLCITSGTVPATATSAVWSFLDSPGGVPPDHAGYYLFARMKDPSGALVASDQTGPDRLLGVDSLLVPTLRVTNALDESSTLLLQNGLSRIVNLEVAYPESVIAIGFAGTFDTSLVQITGITPGTPWDGLGGTASFNQDFSNVSGSFEVSSSVTSAPTGLSAPDSRVVARIVFKARPHAITLRTPHREGEIQLVSSGSGITDIHGRSPDELWAESLGLRVAYLGDIATTGAAPDSTPPHLVPHPDGTIDFSDRDALHHRLEWGQPRPGSDRGPRPGLGDGARSRIVSRRKLERGRHHGVHDHVLVVGGAGKPVQIPRTGTGHTGVERGFRKRPGLHNLPGGGRIRSGNDEPERRRASVGPGNADPDRSGSFGRAKPGGSPPALALRSRSARSDRGPGRRVSPGRGWRPVLPRNRPGSMRDHGQPSRPLPPGAGRRGHGRPSRVQDPPNAVIAAPALLRPSLRRWWNPGPRNPQLGGARRERPLVPPSRGQAQSRSGPDGFPVLARRHLAGDPLAFRSDRPPPARSRRREAGAGRSHPSLRREG